MKRICFFVLSFLFQLGILDGQTSDSLKSKHLRVNAIIGSGVNNTFMGYQRVKQLENSPSSHSAGSQTNQSFSNTQNIIHKGIIPVDISISN